MAQGDMRAFMTFIDGIQRYAKSLHDRQDGPGLQKLFAFAVSHLWPIFERAPDQCKPFIIVIGKNFLGLKALANPPVDANLIARVERLVAILEPAGEG